MSGIFGLFNQNGAPATQTETTQMAALLERRGPDRTGIWHQACVGIGHTLLATTPEALFEHQPFAHTASGCTITADVRLDNRGELLTALRLTDRAKDIGDAEIILQSYLAWGQDCVEHFLGDFTFAIYDSKQKTLFCARDHFGVRPFYYHHTPGQFFVFASEPRAILALEKVPCIINEGRIADFLVNQLEGIDKTSTFFANIYRLPPAHSVTVTPDNMQLRRYWKLQADPELQLSSDDEYAEALLEVFTKSVNCRLRSAGKVGSMLSGGMDSGSIVAVAKELLAKEGKGPLSTFSAIGPDSAACTETRTIHAALNTSGIDPHTISYDQLDAMLPELSELTWNQNEPFDNHMTLPRAVYLLAQQQGINIIMDGIDGDTVLSEGSHIARLLRRGNLITAYREAVGQNLFWKGSYPAWHQLYLGVRSAYTPETVKYLYHRLINCRRNKRTLEKSINTSLINRHFAQQINLGKRLQKLNSHSKSGMMATSGSEAAHTLSHPYLTVGIERYNRVASALAIEPRHPWLDRRLVSFCMTLPSEQKLGQGWPKMILRRAMSNHLPDAVRWRKGKEHLGWEFTKVLTKHTQEDMLNTITTNSAIINSYINKTRFEKSLLSIDNHNIMEKADDAYEAACLAAWFCSVGEIEDERKSI